MRTCIFLLFIFTSFNSYAQDIPARWDELTASDWPLAMEKSNKTIILPIGVLEKHGPHAPMGSDLIRAREWAARVTQEEYAVVFPDYFYGQLNEAKHLPGTFSLPPGLTMELLEATCEELGRNGFERIMIINGHGGNPSMLRYFVQNQMASQRDYAVYFYDPSTDPDFQEKLNTLRKTDPAGDMHAGELETSSLLYLRPELVQLDRATNESGADQKRLPEIPNVYTGIWWYASFPLHYAGEAEKASAELGELVIEQKVASMVEALRAIKADDKTLELQQEFYEKVHQLSEEK
ncbi:creatininase family protein [Salegentibacter sediminis]|uniref:creatininase family protein n=1 Tax=Salegentibacter sediminis TaxID=1930251 RepID=UPI0009BD5D21|nr:creatininase family protein [Salegentibacter sediminis]